MKYSKPEIEIIEINAIDVIATSGGGSNEGNEETTNPTPGGSGTPIVPFNNYWGN